MDREGAVAGMTVGKVAQPKFIVADSKFKLEIKDVKEFQRGSHVTTEKILLMALSDASWTIEFYYLRDMFYFVVAFHNFPEELKTRSQDVFSLSCDNQEIASTHSSGSLRDSRIAHYSSYVASRVKDNKITLSCRLVITCDGVSSLRKKFYDPQTSKKSILGSVSDMLGDPTFSDFTFIVGGQEFKVHMNILAAASPVMKKMFTTDMEEAKTKKCTVDAISSSTFNHLLKFIYRSEVPFYFAAYATAMMLYDAAHYYEIENLKQLCVQEIHENLSPQNAMKVFEWVEPYDLEELKMEAWAIVKRDILKIFCVLKSEPLSVEQTRAIIKHREQDKKFWKQLEKEIAAKAETKVTVKVEKSP